MTIKEIATRLVELANKGDFETIYKELYSPDVVSIEMKGAPNEVAYGMAGIQAKGKSFGERLDGFHGQEIGEPIFADNFFALRWVIDVTYKGKERAKDEELCLYEVRDGKIVREQFFYTLPS